MNDRWKSRPTGNAGEYADFQKWSRQRLAWEALRRLPEFQEACDHAVASDSADKKTQIAKRFRLRRFKDYIEEYSTSPRLRFTHIEVWRSANLKPGRTKSVTIKLEFGHVAVRFDLSAASIAAQTLAAQLASAKRRLQVVRKRFEALAEKPKSRRSKHNELECIRVLDALAAGVDKPKFARENLACPDGTFHDDDWRHVFDTRLKAARKFVQTYLKIAATRATKLEDQRKNKRREPS